MKRLALIAIAFASLQASAVGYKVAWGVSVRNLIYCYPAGDNGKALPNVEPVSDSFCLATFGAEWGRSRDGRTLCYPRSMPGMPKPRFPVAAGWCLR